MYRIAFQSGPYQGKRLLIRRRTTRLGSGELAHLRFPADTGIEPIHAILEENAGLLAVTPVAAVALNGKPLATVARLRNGDVLDLAGIRIRFFIEEISSFADTRRGRGPIQNATALLLLSLLAVQLFLVFFTARWRTFLDVPTPEATKEEADAVALARAEAERAAARAKRAEAKKAEASSVAHELSPIDAPTIALTPADAPAASPELKAALENADFAPVDTNTVIPVPQVSPADDRIARAQKTLAEAVALAEFSDMPGAIETLEQLEKDFPAFLPAYEEHARLLARMDRPDDAIARWQAGIRHARDNESWRETARSEIATLRKLMAIRPAAAGEEAADTASLPAASFRDLDLKRLPADRDVADMRVLSFTLAAPKTETRGISARLDIAFFDRAEDGTVTRSGATVTPSNILWTDLFAHSSAPARSFDATYVIPRGYREHEAARGHPGRAYYGYVIRLTAFDGRELAAVAKPHSLLLNPAASPAAMMGDKP